MNDAAEAPDTEDAATEESAVTKMAAKSKPPAKKTTKGKAVALKAPDAEVLAATSYTVAATEIENIATQEAAMLEAEKLMESVQAQSFRLGGVLSLMYRKGWHEGFETFADMVNAKFNIGYRKAMYLVAMYDNLIKSNIPFEKVQHIGWTKLARLSEVLTEENVDEWVKKAEAMNTADLAAAIKQAQQNDTKAPDKKESETKTMTFKLHRDQHKIVETAIEKAKALGKTDVNSYALELIVTAWLNKPVGNATPPEPHEGPGLDFNDDGWLPETEDGWKVLFGHLFAKIVEAYGDDYKGAVLAMLDKFDDHFPKVALQVEIN